MKNEALFKNALIVIVTALVVIALIVVFALWYFSPDSSIEEITSIEGDYIKNADEFNVEYGIATPEKVDSFASLERAKKGIEGARPLLVKMKDNSTQIKEVIYVSKSKFSGEKLQWFEKVEECYNSRLEMIENYVKVLSNEDKYFMYYESMLKHSSTYDEFSQLLARYVVYSKDKDKNNTKKTLNEMKDKVDLMRTYLKKANESITLHYLNGLIDWANKYSIVIELGILYVDASGSEKDDLDKQLLEKGLEAGKILNDATARSREDFDDWYVPNVTNLRDIADKNFLSANQACGDASNLYESLFQ